MLTSYPLGISTSPGLERHRFFLWSLHAQIPAGPLVRATRAAPEALHFLIHGTLKDSYLPKMRLPISGWWYTYPSEKYERQLGCLFPIYGKSHSCFKPPTRYAFCLNIECSNNPLLYHHHVHHYTGHISGNPWVSSTAGQSPGPGRWWYSCPRYKGL